MRKINFLSSLALVALLAFGAVSCETPNEPTDKPTPVVKPEDGVSTKEAYAAVDALENMKHPKNQQMLELISDGEADEALKLCANVFEQALEVPGRVDIKAICNNCGAVASCMTGSGSAVYGIFKQERDAKKAIEELKLKFKNVYLCTPEKYGVEVIE